MKRERRGDPGIPASPSLPETEKKPETGRKKPVIVYILILFIVAFLLMAFSLLVHQRNNTEALGRLQSSVTAMQEVQDLQDQVIQLQKELADTEEALSSAEEERDSLDQALSEAQDYTAGLIRKSNADYHLYALQQKYLLQDFEGCREIIRAMEDGNLAAELPDGGGSIDVTAPSVRYQELKEAVEARKD